ncbi:MaoC family dehydratase [Nocardia sp. NBC_01329]|nr:MaoC family dehydratase [Nocardia sp. NBC_01329]
MSRRIPLTQLPELIGEHLGRSDWLSIEQNRIDAFAAATDDHQWIHTDPARASHGPFGTTIAHGYLTLSLVIPLWEALVTITGVTTKVNYGLERVRFPAPTPVGSRVRLGVVLRDATHIAGGQQILLDATVEAEGVEKPVCVAQQVFRLYE